MVDAANEEVLAILTRAPSAGGKTRLFAALNQEPDPELLAAMLLDTLDNASVLGLSRVIAVTPPSGCEEVRSMVPQDVRVIAQGEGTLGDRMRGVMSTLFGTGARAVVLLGSDIPTITPASVTAAFAALAREPEALVLGPSSDGGYYLIGAGHLPDVFNGIEWGTSRVLAQTQSAARSKGRVVRLLDMLTDVDYPESLLACADDPRAVRTALWLSTHGLRAHRPGN